MNQQLNEIKEALSKANLPYNYHEDTGDIYGPGDEHLLVNFIYHDEDAELILNAPQWLASLVSQVEEMQKTLEDQKLRMQDGYKNGYESETVFWTRCIWEIDQTLKGDKP